MEKTVKTLSQIASEYGIHINTLRRWIKPIKNDLKQNNRKLLGGDGLWFFKQQFPAMIFLYAFTPGLTFYQFLYRNPIF